VATLNPISIKIVASTGTNKNEKERLKCVKIVKEESEQR